ncbi:MAG: isopenicillin N synthase family dioxygenase [Candidatus Binatia bacterium]
MPTMPIIDLLPWWEGTPSGRRHVAGAVDEALRDVGFLLIANHRIPPHLTAAARVAAKSFFALPPEVKAAYSVDPAVYRGWAGPGSQSNSASYGIDTPPDLKETFSVGPFDVPDDEYHRTAGAWFAPNRLPPDRPDITDGLRGWYTALAALAYEILQIFAVGLGLHPQALQRHCERPVSLLSVNWYPPYTATPPEVGQFRAGPHTDFGTLTIVDRQPGVAGLQVQDDAGEWRDAPVVPGTLTVNIGDLMALWTGGRWRSTRHRVLPPSPDAPNEELVSLIFFHEADYDAVITPLTNAAGIDAEPVIAGEYLRKKLDKLGLN